MGEWTDEWMLEVMVSVTSLLQKLSGCSFCRFYAGARWSRVHRAGFGNAHGFMFETGCDLYHPA